MIHSMTSQNAGIVLWKVWFLPSFRTRLWLLISYLLSFGAVLGSVIILISDYALKDINIWPGVVSRGFESHHWVFFPSGMCLTSCVCFGKWFSVLSIEIIEWFVFACIMIALMDAVVVEYLTVSSSQEQRRGRRVLWKPRKRNCFKIAILVQPTPQWSLTTP